MQQKLVVQDNNGQVISSGSGVGEAPRPEVLNSDIVLPKILLMQGLSEFVKARSAQLGDFVRSNTQEILGGPKKAVEFIPLAIKNEWMNFELIGQKPKFRGSEPRTAANEHLDWDYVRNGAPWRRLKVINCFTLLPQDIAAEQGEIKRFQETGEMPDLNKTLMPVVVSFRSTSYNAGKTVATHFAKAAAMAQYGVKPHGFTLELHCHEDANDKGDFFVMEVKQGKRIPQESLALAEKWVQILATQNVRVDESQEEESEDLAAERKAQAIRASELKQF